MRQLFSVEGNRQALDGGAMFGNAPKAYWESLTPPDDHNRITLSCRALLVDDDGRRILFETGIGVFFAPKMRERFGVVETEHVLLTQLESLGLTHSDIDVVVLSHLHFDHAGGLLSAYVEGAKPKLLFPKAQFVVGNIAFERAEHPHARDRASFIPELQTLLRESGRLVLVDENDAKAVLGEGFRFHLSNGHTPGLLLTEIAMPNGPVLYAGDLIPGAPWVHLPITMGYDRFPELLIDEKRTVLEHLEKNHGRLFFTHDVNVALADVVVSEKGRYQTAREQTTVRGLAE